MNSFGIELHEIPFEYICEVLNRFGIKFDWEEKNTEIPRRAFSVFERLAPETRLEMGGHLLQPIQRSLIDSVSTTIQIGEDWAKRVNEIELLIRTEQNEYFTSSFNSTREAINYLLNMQMDVTDLRGKV
jgi:hypothetical protein